MTGNDHQVDSLLYAMRVTRTRRIQTGIEVVTVGDRFGRSHQEPGNRHWLPGVYDYVQDDRLDATEVQYTACQLRTDGMVLDKAEPEELTCPDCAARYTAWRLATEPPNG